MVASEARLRASNISQPKRWLHSCNHHDRGRDATLQTMSDIGWHVMCYNTHRRRPRCPPHPWVAAFIIREEIMGLGHTICVPMCARYDRVVTGSCRQPRAPDKSCAAGINQCGARAVSGTARRSALQIRPGRTITSVSTRPCLF